MLTVRRTYRACVAVAWHPHDENLLVFAESNLAVHIVGERQSCGPLTCTSVALICAAGTSVQSLLEDLLFSPRSSFAADVRFPFRHQQLLVGEGQPSLLSIDGLCISPDSRIWVATNVSGVASWLPNCAALIV